MRIFIVIANITFENQTFKYPQLLHVSAIFDQHVVVFAITCMENNTEVKTSPLQLHVMVKVTLEQATMVKGGSRCVPLLFL